MPDALRAVDDTDAPAPAEDKAPTLDEQGPVTVKLSKIVTVLDERKEELVFREPTSWDLVQIGNPFNPVWDGKIGYVDCDYRVLVNMLCRLGGPNDNAPLPQGTFGKQMRARDLESCRRAVQPFFV
jgi:hypothetical protein